MLAASPIDSVAHVVRDQPHGVVDREAGRDRAAGRVDVERDVAPRVLGGEQEQLRAELVGDRVVDLLAEHDDALVQQAVGRGAGRLRVGVWLMPPSLRAGRTPFQRIRCGPLCRAEDVPLRRRVERRELVRRSSSESAASAESSCSDRADADDRLPARAPAARRARPASGATPRDDATDGQRRKARGRARVVVRRRGTAGPPGRSCPGPTGCRPTARAPEVLGEVVDGLVADEAEAVVLARHGRAGPRLDVRRRQLERRCTARRPGPPRASPSLLDPPGRGGWRRRAAVRRPRATSAPNAATVSSIGVERSSPCAQ